MTPQRIRKSLLSALALPLAVSLSLSACSSDADAGSASNDNVTIGVNTGPNSFDPILSIWGGQWAVYMNSAYDTLLHQEPDGSFSPGLAESWEYISTTQFRLAMRPDVVFSDGETPVDAVAVKANLDRLFTVTGPLTADLAPMLESVEIVDDLTVDVNLSSPNPSLERIFSQLLGMMVNPNALNDPDALALEPQGAGPYTLDAAATVVNDTYVFTKNEHYREPDAYPYETLTAKVYADQNAMLTALQSGVAQIGYGSPDTIAAAEGSGLEVVSQPVNVFMLVFNDRTGALTPALGDVRVRQALNYAVDREAILESVYRGQGAVTTQVFPEGTDGFDPELDDAYPYDPDRAKQLLAEAGYADGFSFEVAVWNPGRDTNYIQALASYFDAVGVTMTIDPLPAGSRTVEVLSQYPAMSNGYGGQDTFGDARILLMPPSALNNPLGSERDEFTDLWQAGAAAADAEERGSIYRELSAGVVDEGWFVATTALNAIAFYDPRRVAGVVFTPHISVPLIYGWQPAS